MPTITDIEGVGGAYAAKLRKAGVRTDPANLFEKMTSVNDKKKLVRKMPTASQVKDWIKQAKSLPRAVEY